ERLRCSYENVGRGSEHGGPLRGGSVAAAYRSGDPDLAVSHLLRQAANLSPRLGEVLVDVGGERLQRRDVDHPGLVRQATGQRFSQQRVQLYQKGGECLA